MSNILDFGETLNCNISSFKMSYQQAIFTKLKERKPSFILRPIYGPTAYRRGEAPKG
jgi:hypothetical protein